MTGFAQTLDISYCSIISISCQGLMACIVNNHSGGVGRACTFMPDMKPRGPKNSMYDGETGNYNSVKQESQL